MFLLLERAVTKYPALRIQCSQGMINETSNSQTVLEGKTMLSYNSGHISLIN